MGNQDLGQCGSDIVAVSMLLCECLDAETSWVRQPLNARNRYIVDAADKDSLAMATDELHDLVSKPTLRGIPLLVLGNKSDLPNKLSVDELIDAMRLKTITHREVSCYGISAKEETNLDAVLHWLIARSNK